MPEEGNANDQPVTPSNAEPPVVKPYKLKFRLQTPRGVYEVNRPIGRFGALHFSLMSRCMPDNYDPDGTPLYKGNVKTELADVFKEWSIQLLKHLIVKYPEVDGKSLTYETTPGEDQYAIFMMVVGETDTSLTSFRVLD